MPTADLVAGSGTVCSHEHADPLTKPTATGRMEEDKPE
jgi:hypothetical protein